MNGYLIFKELIIINSLKIKYIFIKASVASACEKHLVVHILFGTFIFQLVVFS